MTFYDDTINGKSIVECCQEVAGSDKEEKTLLLLIDYLITYIQSRNFQWIFICDQHNALFNPSVIKNFPFNIINILARNRATNIKVIISTSANNEGYPTEMKGWHTHDVSTHYFDQGEFALWCYHNSLPNDIQVDAMSEDADDAFFWTGIF